MTAQSERDELADALAAWDVRCQQYPEGQPTRRVPNRDETLRLEAALRVVAHRAGCTTYRLRQELSAARFDGNEPDEAVKVAVARCRRGSEK